MCLHPRPAEPVPKQTARVARAAFPNANPYMRMRDEVGTIFEDEDFAGLFPGRGKPAFSPWRLALATRSCSSSRRTSPTGGRPTPYAAGSTGSTPSP